MKLLNHFKLLQFPLRTALAGFFMRTNDAGMCVLQRTVFCAQEPQALSFFAIIGLYVAWALVQQLCEKLSIAGEEPNMKQNIYI